MSYTTSNDHEFIDSEQSPQGYGLNGQIMLTAIIVLFIVVLLMVSIHLYARFYLIRLRRRQNERRRNRHSIHIVHYNANNPRPITEHGLEHSVLNTLPVFKHTSEPNRASELCAVCLSEFEENEVIRMLPKCNHSFHIECIDMWFHSHATCPLCRSPVEPVVELSNEPVVVELCEECKEDCATSSSTSSGKDLEVRVDVGVNIRRDLEIQLTIQSSPTSRMLSLKRILSMGLRSPAGSRVTTPSGAAGTSRGSGSEVDLESGLRESTTPRSRS